MASTETSPAAAPTILATVSGEGQISPRTIRCAVRFEHDHVVARASNVRW
jgi:hypothetical protein